MLRPLVALSLRLDATGQGTRVYEYHISLDSMYSYYICLFNESSECMLRDVCGISRKILTIKMFGNKKILNII